MATVDPPLTAETLAAHGEWLRRLAAYLLHDALDAEDAVQEAWEAALRSPPDPRRPARPWLGQVLRNVIRSRARAASRRAARERSAPVLPESPTSAEDLLARMRLHEQIARLMTALEEPYRMTLLQRFYDGRDAPEIAAAFGVPAGTVRWRISEGIRRLRERLDQQPGGREAWRAALSPLVGPRASGGAGGAAVAPKLLPLAPSAAAVGRAVVAVAVTLAVAGGALLIATLRTLPGLSGRPAVIAGDRVGRAAGAPPPRGQRSPGPAGIRTNDTEETNETKEETMRRASLKRAAAFLGVALPALVAGAEEKPDPLLEEGIDLCVAMRERFFECREEFADAIVARRNPPPAQRDALRRKAIEGITADGSGPVEPRRERCAAMARPGKPPPTEKAGLERLKKALAECTAKPDCTTRVACMIEVFPPGGGKRPKR